MYCSECGAKNKKNALYCEECGKKLKKIEETPKKIHKKLSKKQTIMIIAVITIILLFLIIFQVLKSTTTPSTIVGNYIEAITDKDYDKLYTYANYSGDTTFMNKEIYKTAIKEQISESDEIANYVVGQTEYENGGLTAVVTVNAIVIGDKQTPKTLKIKLTKSKKKKFLFFPKWTISDDELLNINTIEDFNLIVPKDTKIIFEGIKVKDKYLNKKEKSDNTDTYTLPQVLTTFSKIEYQLPGNLKVIKTIVPSKYKKEYKLDILKTDISTKNQKELINTINDTTEEMMKGLIDKKDFKELKDIFAKETKANRYKDLEEDYEEYLKHLNESDTKLTNFNVTTTNISKVDLTDEGELTLTVKMNYTWKESKDGKETEKNTSRYYTFYLIPENNTYEVVGISNVPTTISIFW